jgi:hypothetical protein
MRVSGVTAPRSFIAMRAAMVAAASGAVHIPSSRARSRWLSSMAASLTAMASPRVSRMIRNIWRPAKGDGTRNPAASVTGLSHGLVVSAPSCQALTIGAQPSACTLMKRGSVPRIQPNASSSSYALAIPTSPVPPPVG